MKKYLEMATSQSEDGVKFACLMVLDKDSIKRYYEETRKSTWCSSGVTGCAISIADIVEEKNLTMSVQGYSDLQINRVRNEINAFNSHLNDYFTPKVDNKKEIKDKIKSLKKEIKELKIKLEELD